jgi:transposase
MNRLKMAKINAILHLRSQGWSFRRIARELEIDRQTVADVVKRHRIGSKPAIAPSGSAGSKPATFGPLPAPDTFRSAGNDPVDNTAASKPAIAPTGSGAPVRTELSPSPAPPAPSAAGRPNRCVAYHEVVVAKLDQQLSAQRIFQDLVEEHGYTGSYYSVRRYVARLTRTHEWPLRRLECEPGHEAQADYGRGIPLVDGQGRRRKTHLFRLVLSHSRKAYSEVSYRQTTEEFIRCLENAFWYFGGVPRTLVIDNLRAAVKHPDWFDPELVPKLSAFCEHYDLVILPTRVRMPRHKGKVERCVDYAQENALKGRSFASLSAQNEHLLRWEQQVADKRIHGTTKRQVGPLFDAAERAALRPLPRERFPLFQEAERKVARDGHVEVAKSYYLVPPEYLGRTVWVRWDARLVRIFNQRLEQIDVHVRLEPGRFSTKAEHLRPEKISGLERGAERLLEQVEFIGGRAHAWAQAMLHARGLAGTRVLLGLLSLRKKHDDDALNQTCGVALAHGVFRLRTLRQLLQRKTPEKQAVFAFLDQHPIIRPLDDYARVVARAAQRDAAAPRGFERHDRTKASCEARTPTAGDGPADAPTPSSHLLPPRSGYPSSGCSPAGPDSVSPNDTKPNYPFLNSPGDAS